jgi:hypothetical protein
LQKQKQKYQVGEPVFSINVNGIGWFGFISKAEQKPGGNYYYKVWWSKTNKESIWLTEQNINIYKSYLREYLEQTSNR